MDEEVRDNPRAPPACRCHDEVVAARLLIVDDHPGFRAMARALLESAGVDIVGEATGAAEALRLAASLRPDAILLDIALPDGDGFDVCEQVNEDPNPPAVILTSSRSAAVYTDRLDATQARGFIPKSQLTGASVAALVD
jgi:DNA-binding NarL/FixJ family response regulator